MKASNSWEAALDRTIERLSPLAIEIRRHLHSHPEPSGAEFETTEFLRRHLAELPGVDVQTVDGATGLIVDPASSPRGPRIAARADIDALRIQDAKDVPYRSQSDGVMHACGHDAHAATLLIAVAGLAELGQEGAFPWPVAWRAVFQPSEETATGASEMVSRNALEGVDAILSLHMDPSLPAGSVGVRTGVFTAACDEMEIRVAGRGGHAARPHESIDPIAAAAQLIGSIYLFVPRAIDSHEPVVVTIGKIEGGHNANVIPEEVVLHGTLRTLGGPVREQTIAHLRTLVRGIAETSGTTIELAFAASAPGVVNDRSLTALVRETALDLVAPDRVVEIARPSMGSEDFAVYLEHVPGCMFRLGCSRGLEPGPSLHSPHFDVEESSLALGAKILARAIVGWCDPDRQEHR